jgi:acyl-CoA thioesterase I
MAPPLRRARSSYMGIALIVINLLFVNLGVMMAGGATQAWGGSQGAVRIVAFGDSLTAGYMLPPGEAFPAQLAAALKARGHNVEITNAGVSGDTTLAGLERFDWSVPDGTDAVILELGANDALRGIDPATTRKNLDEILAKLKARNIDVLLAGMSAPQNWGADYADDFKTIYKDLSAKYGALLYPFFLDGIAQKPELNLSDGLHPTGKGVAIVVERIVPSVESLLARVAERKAATAKN